MYDLTGKKCVPCEGGVPPLNSEQVAEYRKQTPDWAVEEDGKSISREFLFKNFKEALAFVNKVGKIAERLQHHPDICIKDYKDVFISTTTHDVGSAVTTKDRGLVKEIDSL